MDENAILYRKDLIDHVGNLMYFEIEEGNVGAVVVDDEGTDSHYLVEWGVSSPFFVESNGNNTLMCSGIHWNPVRRAPKWYTTSNPIQQA